MALERGYCLALRKAWQKLNTVPEYRYKREESDGRIWLWSTKDAAKKAATKYRKQGYQVQIVYCTLH